MRILTMILMTIVLASCGAAATPTGNATTEPATGATTVPTTVPTEAPAETTAPATGATTAPATGGDMIGPSAQVLASLAQQLNVDVTNLQLVNAEEQQWSNSGLGCEQNGMMYTQVITPGYLITFTDGTTTYEVHTNETGAQAVLCQAGVPTDLTTIGS